MKFNEKQIKELSQNPNVEYVTPSHVYYSENFKEKAIKEYELGKSARQIFIDAGLKLQYISNSNDYASKKLSKWRSERNPNNIHYPKKKKKTFRTDYQKMKARLEYLEAENEFLKKLSALCNEYRA